jgi:TIR domain-containing protein
VAATRSKLGRTVFLSYASADAEFARGLGAQLRRLGFSVWDSAIDLLPGDNWGKELGKALEHADSMVVLVSRDAARSPWVQKEIEYALGEPRFKGRLVPVLIEHAPDAPWILRTLEQVPAAGGPEQAGERVASVLRAHAG